MNRTRRQEPRCEVEVRAVGKCPDFDGTHGRWSAWRFRFETWIALSTPGDLQTAAVSTAVVVNNNAMNDPDKRFPVVLCAALGGSERVDSGLTGRNVTRRLSWCWSATPGGAAKLGPAGRKCVRRSKTCDTDPKRRSRGAECKSNALSFPRLSPSPSQYHLFRTFLIREIWTNASPRPREKCGRSSDPHLSLE